MPTDVERSRRRRLVYHALCPHLPAADVQRAVALCDLEFATGAFSSMRFLHRLGQTVPGIGNPVRLFEHLQKLIPLPADQIGPDPTTLTPLPAARSGGVGTGGVASWAASAGALLAAVESGLASAAPRLAVQWREQATPLPPFGTTEALHSVIHDRYLWVCEAVGPVLADKLFTQAVKAVDALPGAATFPPAKLL